LRNTRKDYANKYKDVDKKTLFNKKFGEESKLNPKPRTVYFAEEQVQEKFKDHSTVFGMSGNSNKRKSEQFKIKMEEYITSSETLMIDNGTYRKNTPAVLS
jgi:hypothetical protein